MKDEFSDEEEWRDPRFTDVIVEDEIIDEEVHSSEEEEFEGRSEQRAAWSPREDDEEDDEEEEEDKDSEDEDEDEEDYKDEDTSFQQNVEAMPLSKEERKICKKFAAHVTNSAVSNGWEEHEIARMIHFFFGSLGMTVEKMMAFLNDLKLGSPLLLSSLCQQGIDFTPGQIISMIKVDSWDGTCYFDRTFYLIPEL